MPWLDRGIHCQQRPPSAMNTPVKPEYDGFSHPGGPFPEPASIYSSYAPPDMFPV
jgi:hypothetical protein